MINQAKLLESIADMQLGNIAPEEWLEGLTGILNCTAIGTIVWAGNEPEHNHIRSTKRFKNIPIELIPVAEQIIRLSDTSKLDYLDEMAKALNEGYLPPHDHNLLIIPLDKGPTRVLMILQRDGNSADWSTVDRENISAILPGLRKANDLHKSVILSGNKLDIATKILNGAPRAIAALSPKGHILKANTLALKLFSDKDGFNEVNDKLLITNRQVQIEFEEKLDMVCTTKLEELHHFVWNRSFATNQQTLQIVLRAFPLDNWHLESNPYDRFVALFIHTPDSYIRPSENDLKDFYGLTRAQARLVISLLDGNSISTAAKKQKISINTARSHLQSIYATMGVTSQSEMMRVIGVTLVNYVPPK